MQGLQYCHPHAKTTLSISYEENTSMVEDMWIQAKDDDFVQRPHSTFLTKEITRLVEDMWTQAKIWFESINLTKLPHPNPSISK